MGFRITTTIAKPKQEEKSTFIITSSLLAIAVDEMPDG